jgi:hypothetical protein
MPTEIDALKYIGGLLIALIVYVFLDAKSRINEKADKEALIKAEKSHQDALSNAVDTWKEDLKDAKDLHQRETERMERQYDVKFAGVVKDFSDRMNSIESNLSQRMELILRLLESKK